MKTAEFLDWAESVWPTNSAEAWDNPGLISGSIEQEHSRALITIDITNDVLDEAIESDCSLIIAHHPLLLGGIETLRQDTFKGLLISRAIKNDVALFAAHTNADIVTGGVSDALAKKIGIENAVALDGNAEGHGRIGKIKPQTLHSFLENIQARIPTTAKGVAYIGDPRKTIETVALVAGSGMSFAHEIKADVFITSDIKHHPALDFKEQANVDGTGALIEISHYAAESIWLEGLSEQLSETGLEVVVSKTNTDPWDGVLI
jgi:dinuclear metal center YbgI/SA1388 family protein